VKLDETHGETPGDVDARIVSLAPGDAPSRDRPYLGLDRSLLDDLSQGHGEAFDLRLDPPNLAMTRLAQRADSPACRIDRDADP
jgi:hypothetical protein